LDSSKIIKCLEIWWCVTVAEAVIIASATTTAGG
jgi:hypothetical protein